jgi:hypothetical protein
MIVWNGKGNGRGEGNFFKGDGHGVVEGKGGGIV